MRPDVEDLFTASFGPAVCTQIALMAMVAGREPTAGDMEPLSWALYQRCRALDSVQALGAEFLLHVPGAIVVGAAVLGVGIALISRWWTRIYVAELRSAA